MKKTLLLAYRLALSPLLLAGGLLMIAVMLAAYGPSRASEFAHSLADVV